MPKFKGILTICLAAALACTGMAISVSADTRVSSQQELDDFLTAWQVSIAEQRPVQSPDERLQSLNFSSDNQTVFDVRESYELTLDVEPDTARKDFTFSSSDSDVAGVTNGGMLTAYAPGTAVITVRSKSAPWATDTLTVRVRGQRDSGVDVAAGAPLTSEALVAAVGESGGGTVHFSNQSAVTAGALQAAAAAGNSKVAFSTRDRAGNLVARLTVNPASAANLRADRVIRTLVHYNNAETESVRLALDERHANTLYVIKCEQDHFSMLVNLKVQVGGGVDPQTLRLYSYDKENGRLQAARIESATVDSLGYVSFYTDKGGYLVLSQGELRL